MYDVAIVGSGVVGSAVARELSRCELDICVLEKEEDVCCGTSKANSAIVHAGYDAIPGTIMALMNVRGNYLMEKLSKDLDFPFERNGALVLCLDKNDFPRLQILYDQGMKNGVRGLEILYKDEILKMEPNVSESVYAALYAPSAGIVCPFSLNIALAENACENGVEFRFDTEVEKIDKMEKGGFHLRTNRGDIEAKVVVNAAGVYADLLHNMVSKKKIRITPRKGEYCLLDKSAGTHVKNTIFALPTKYGKGVLVTPTVHGNLLIGPTAVDVDDKEGTDTTKAGLDEVIEKAKRSVRNIPMQQVITSFAGLRAHEDGHDFMIGEVSDAEGFIDCAGIESPGLASSPAIGEKVAVIVREKLNPNEKKSFVETRCQSITKDAEYGTIICRCEMVTEEEIVDAIRRPLGAKSLDGVKRRTRAGMGRCQSGFCSPRVMEILARELDIPISEVTKAGKGSEIIIGKNKDCLQGE